MFIADLFAALAFGLLVVLIFSVLLGTKGPWGSLLLFFLAVTLCAWVGGVWLRPYGPVWMGASWIPILFVGFLAAILLAAASPRNRRKRVLVKGRATTEEDGTAVGSLFWFAVICLLAFGMSHYYWYPQLG